MTRHRTALTLLVAFACAACGTQHSPGLPAISATQIPGNARVVYLHRVIVSDTEIVRQRRRLVGAWQTISRTPLTKSLRARFQAAAASIHPGSMRVDEGACNGLPQGDVGGTLLRVGSLASNCAPPSARPLLNLLAPYLG